MSVKAFKIIIKLNKNVLLYITSTFHGEKIILSWIIYRHCLLNTKFKRYALSSKLLIN